MTSFGTVAHIALVVREMTPAVEFYETVLGPGRPQVVPASAA